MGLSNFLHRLLARKERRVLVLGLAGAGKTAAIDWLVAHGDGGGGKTVATERFTVRTATLSKLSFSFWEIGGGDTLRPYWRHYYAGTQGVMFVVDVTGDDRAMATAASELEQLALDEQLLGVPIVVLLHKVDALTTSATEHTIKRDLRLDATVSRSARPWKVLQTSSRGGMGLQAAVDFLAQSSQPL